LNEGRKNRLMTGPAAEYMSKVAGEKEKNDVAAGLLPDRTGPFDSAQGRLRPVTTLAMRLGPGSPGK